jgi:hypothetical protein
MSRILCIYPDYRSTKFLNSIQVSIKHILGDRFHCYKIKPTVESHVRCLAEISVHDSNESIIFLGHGRNNSLFGADFPSTYGFVSDDYLAENPHEEHLSETFISSENVSVFNSKKVFCLTCNSADGLGELAIEAGAKVFFGFGDIPTDNLADQDSRLYLDRWKSPMPDRLTSIFKGEIQLIVKSSLLISLNRKLSYGELANIIRYKTNLRICDILKFNKV